jgi:hypothetical protein
MNQLPLRAETDEQKAEVMSRILELWQTKFNTFRLGQMLLNLTKEDSQLWVIEDKAIVAKLEEWADRIDNLL